MSRKVSYFFDSDIGTFHYGQGHPMKPHRVRMAHNLIVSGLSLLIASLLQRSGEASNRGAMRRPSPSTLRTGGGQLA
jgi:hypothetical protein